MIVTTVVNVTREEVASLVTDHAKKAIGGNHTGGVKTVPGERGDYTVTFQAEPKKTTP